MDNILPILLKTLSEGLIVQEYETLENNEFNIFKVLGITNREVLICRFLGELLDPKGSHGQGTRFLKSFIRTVLCEDVEKCSLSNATIELEEVIKDNRRVDIAIHINKKVYPIEVKIWAADQDAQLKDYHSYYNDKGLSCEKIYYLTPDGHKPPSSSTRGLNDAQIATCSFKVQIKEWISSEIMDDNVSTLYVILKQFKGAIETMCAKYKKERTVMENVFQKENDKNTCLAALEIIRYRDTIIEEFQYRYLDSALIKHFEKNPSVYKINRLDQNSDEQKEDVFRKYEIVKDNKDIAFICIKKNLYLKLNKGYTIKENDESFKPDEDHILWRYLCTEKAKIIDLKDPTDSKFPLSFDDKIILNIDDLEKIIEEN